MAEKTFIEWAESTWNPWYGCSKVSPGCDNCYAQVWANRTAHSFSKVTRAAQSGFTAPIGWKKPRRVFVCSLSDFFHPDINEMTRAGAMQIMSTEAPQHTYMLLTKRPQYIKAMLRGSPWQDGIPGNVWMGVTAENQAQADIRLLQLQQVHAYVRFVSVEPMLGPVNLAGWPWLNWVICGGESGPQARPMHPAWPLALRDQCETMQIPFFFKQWGEYFSLTHDLNQEEAKDLKAIKMHDRWFIRAGKNKNGCLMGGREYKELP